jgi:hypothetical protein
MADILKVAYTLANTNVTQVLIKILEQKSTEKFIVNLNTRVQLYKDGENSEGVKLSTIGGSYKPSTIAIKKAQRPRRPTNRVTLYDTGKYHKTFTATPTASADFIIDSDPMKGSFDLFERWGEDVEGLNDENMNKVLDYLEAKFWAYIFRKSK